MSNNIGDKPSLYFCADEQNTESLAALAALINKYGQAKIEDTDAIIALGGDGYMLHTMHKAMDLRKPVFGMNFGHIGFLMNEFNLDNLIERVKKSHSVTVPALKMVAHHCRGGTDTFYALNEVSLLRQVQQAAHIKITLDGHTRMEKLVCDGVVVATPAGSTAYNFSAGGPIVPITSNLMAITPLSPFRPRRWRGALLPNTVKLRIEVLESDKRPVSVSADFQEARNVCAVDIEKSENKTVTLLYDSHQTLADRVIEEQFTI